jgi:hypothetical protein
LVQLGLLGAVGPAAHAGVQPDDASPLGEFTPLTPARILDTRDGTGRGGVVGGIAGGAPIPVQVTGRGGVPGSGVQAVVLNATVTNPTAASYLTIWPAGSGRPPISNLNFVSGQTVANLVTVQLDTASGQVMTYNLQGTVDVIFDVVGFYSNDTGPFGSRFHAVTPTRLLDTRDTANPIGSESTRTLTVDGAGPIPASGVTAVALNVTITEPTAPSFLTVFPNDTSMPLASNVNYVPGLTVPNLVVVRVPTSGAQAGVIAFFNRLGSTHVVVDVVGYYDDDRSTEAGRFYAVTPTRIADTRVSSSFPPPGKIPGGAFYRIGNSDPSASIMGALVFNVTVTEPTEPSYLTVYPDGPPRPLASNLNFVANQTVPNLVMVAAGNVNARVDFYNFLGATHVVVDWFGVFTNASAPAPASAASASAATATRPDVWQPEPAS